MANIKYIKEKIIEVYKECNVHSFPIDLYEIMDIYGICHMAYNRLKIKNEELYEYCIKYSDDAFYFNGMILYNSKKPPNRIRFSIAHELGHIVLEHTSKSEEEEIEANYFASNFLAPRMAIHYAKCKNESDVTKTFHLTNEAAFIAFNDYKRWFRHITYYKMNSLDKELYNCFYNIEQGKFIYNINRCAKCYDLMYNQQGDICNSCKSLKRYNTKFEFENSYDFDKAEYCWLYRDDL